MAGCRGIFGLVFHALTDRLIKLRIRGLAKTEKIHRLDRTFSKNDGFLKWDFF